MGRIYKVLFLSIIMLVSWSGHMYSQYVSFGYDAAGNRIKREIILETYGNDLKKAPRKAFVSEMLSGKTIKIYPNPTKGMLKIEIAGWEETENGSISLYNSGGVRLLSSTVTDSTLTIDITSYPSGIYMMYIKLGESETTWKIIKE